MKIRILLLTVLMITAACGVDNIKNLGRSDCAVDLDKFLDQLEDSYRDLIILPDENGNHQSLEACLQRRLLTETYLVRLSDAQNRNNTQEGCSSEEKSGFNVRIGDRIQDLEEDMESTWDRCEEVYGDGD